jgi:MFS family permease
VPLSGYLSFVSKSGRLVAFGLLATFSSSFGQTYFVGIFGPQIQSEFELSHTAWGSIYMAGTLASAALLPWTGKQIDRCDLRPYALTVCLCLALACLFTSRITGPVTLLVAIFFLRHTGQGLMSHAGITSMARYFDAGRGRAIAIASLGYSAGEALLPFVAVLAIAALGWRWTYAAAGLFTLLVVFPAMLWTLSGHTERHRLHEERLGVESAAGPSSGATGWSREEVIRDPRFYLLLPGVLAPAMVLTAMFFHHLNLADAKGWTHAWITGNYIVFAVATMLTSLAAGPFIDRYGAARLVRYMLVPLVFAMLTVAAVDGAWVVIPYLALAGVNTGLAHTALSALWAELYGVSHLGGIKSLVSSMMVFGTALGPVIMGSLMDLGYSMEAVCVLFAVYAGAGAGLMLSALRG